MKSKSIIVAAFLALTRPAAAAADPGDVVTQSLQIEMPDILGRSAIDLSSVISHESVASIVSSRATLKQYYDTS